MKSAAVTLAVGASLVPVDVYDIGKLAMNDAILVEGRTVLRVDAIEGPTSIKLTNTSGFVIKLYEGMRLIPTTARPSVFKDPFGTTASLGNFLLADENGRVSGYIDEERYDYVTSPTRPPSIDAVSTNTVTGSQATLSWAHTVGGSDRVLLVGVAWQSEGEETLTGATYGGVAMTPLGSSQYVQVFGLVDPPRGTQDVVVTWSGSGHKGAIGGAVSLRGVYLANPLGTAQSGQGTSTTPSVNVTTVEPLGVVFDTVGVNLGAGTVSLTAGAGQTQRWNAVAGASANLDLTRGGGSTEPSAGAGSVTMSWTLGSSKLWGMVGVEAKPASVVVIDAEGSALVHAPFGINARDFQSLADAIAALPATGGEVFLPAGEYRIAEGAPGSGVGVLIDKPNVTLRGEGNRTVIKAAIQGPSYDILRVTKGPFKMVGIDIDGVRGTTPPGTPNGLTIDMNPPESCFLENVEIHGAQDHGLFVANAASLTAIGCLFYQNTIDGVAFSPDTEAPSRTLFVNCAFSYNDNVGVEFTGHSTAGAMFAFVDCGFEGNRGGTLPFTGNALWIQGSQDKSVYVAGCYLENPPEAASVDGNNFILLSYAKCAVIDGCFFFNANPSVLIDRAAQFVSCPAARFSNNIVSRADTDFVDFEVASPLSIELGNTVFLGGSGTGNESVQKLSLSRGVLSMVRWTNALKPAATSVPAGSMTWVINPPGLGSPLQVVVEDPSLGRIWKNVVLL